MTTTLATPEHTTTLPTDPQLPADRPAVVVQDQAAATLAVLIRADGLSTTTYPAPARQTLAELIRADGLA